MSANPSRWPRDTVSPAPAATTQFLPTMPLELAPSRPAVPRNRAASVREIWHDTQADLDEEDTRPSVLDALPPQAAVARPAAPLPTTRPPAAASLDPADPLAGKFNEAVSGLQVRELDNEELFQRLFGSKG